MKVRPILTLSTLTFVLTVASPAFGQAAPTGEYVSRVDPMRTKPSEREYKPSEQAQRAAVISMVAKLVSESKRYSDETLRVRAQAGSADVLWDIDEQYARKLFAEAWTAAEKIDIASEVAAAEAQKKAMSSGRGGMTMIPMTSSLRGEILRLIARRDAKYGNQLVAELDQEKEESKSAQGNATGSISFDPTEPKLALAKRLEVAQFLLTSGDIKQAKAFAEPGLTEATSPGIIFLCTLRQKDPEWADKQYLKLLVRTFGSSTAEPLTISLLSSYVLTPNYIVTATAKGRVSNQFGETAQTSDIPPQLRTRFFDVAASILMRPVQSGDQSIGGRAGAYFTIARLLPQFEIYAPNYVTQLNGQLQLLSSDAPESFRNGQDSMLRVGFPSQTLSDEITPILDQIANAANANERDTLYVKAIRVALSRGDNRIRQFAEKIENEKLKEQARSFADLAAAQMAVKNKDAEAGLQLVRNSYLQGLNRVWALSKVAGLLQKTDPQTARDLLYEADAEAHRIDMATADRVYALTCVAASMVTIDRQRSWAMANDIVKAANSITGFTGEEARLSARLRSRNVFAMINAEEPSFSITNYFAMVAGQDLSTALSATNELTGEPVRVTTSLALARAVLERPRAKQPRR